MPLVKNPTVKYYNIESYGRSNHGKTTFSFSILNVAPAIAAKTKVILFTNETNYPEILEKFPMEKQQQMLPHIYQHSSLEEFENDWLQFCDDMEIDKYGVERIRNEVHAIIVDEAEFLYREGYLARHANALSNKGLELRPADYGVPRSWFMQQMTRMAMLPCHFIVTSKVGDEREQIRHVRRDGTMGAYQYPKTGGDTYRLPDNMIYLPSISMHLFSTQYDIKDDKGEPLLDVAGRQMVGRKYYGETRKQKADRSKQIVIENPTIRKVIVKMTLMRRNVDIEATPKTI